MRSANRGFAHANNRGADDDRRALRPVPQPRHRDRRGHIRRARRARSTSGPRSAWPASSSSRPTATVFPTIRRFPNASRALGRRSAASASRSAAGWLGERELDLARYDARSRATGRRARSCSRAARRCESAGCIDERFFIYCEEPDLCLRMKAGLGRPARADDDDRPPRRQGRHQSADGRAGCLYPAAVRTQALLPAWPRGLRRSGGSRACSAVAPARARSRARAQPEPGLARSTRVLVRASPPPFGPPPPVAIVSRDDDSPASSTDARLCSARPTAVIFVTVGTTHFPSTG